MTFELVLMATMVLMASIALCHSLATRSDRDTLTLLLAGFGFGSVFPYVDVNLFGHYTFEGQLTVFNLPIHLGLAWYALYYMALSLAEWILGPTARRAAVAALAGVIFGLLEAQWDPVLLQNGLMKLFLVSFGTYRFNFNPGVPSFHAYVGFLFAYGFYVLRDAPRPWLGRLLYLGSFLGLPLSIMACNPYIIPIYRQVAAQYDATTLYVFDALHFVTTFVPAAWIGGWWLRWLGRRLGAPYTPRPTA